MDIEKLVEQLHIAGAGNPGNIFDVAATAISTLLAENKKLREMYQKEKAVCHATQAELEQVKRERDTLVEDFVDYVTGGVPNPAIFCKNRCSQCVDMRGWCTGKYCSGFYPSGESGPEEG